MTNQTSDEIDLIQLMVNTAKLLKRNFLLIIICAAVGLMISWGAYTLMPKVYESRMLVYSNILTQTYIEKLGANLEEIVNEKNISILSHRLGLTEEEAKAIEGISLESTIQNEKNIKEDEKIFIVIKVEITDNAILPKLQQGLIGYLEQNDLVQVKVEQKKKYFSELINKINTELQKMELLKDMIGKGTLKSDGGMYMIDTTNPFSASVDLFRARLDYEQALELTKGAQLIEGFTAFDRKIRPRLTVMLPIGFFVGLFLAFVIIFLRYIDNVSRDA